jgi:hypothetical protein
MADYTTLQLSIQGWTPRSLPLRISLRSWQVLKYEVAVARWAGLWVPHASLLDSRIGGKLKLAQLFGKGRLIGSRPPSSCVFPWW